MNKVEFDDFTIINSSLSVFDVGSLAKITSDDRTITFTNIGYYNCSIPTYRSLISTSGFSGNLSLHIMFNNLKFENVQFAPLGSLIELTHQLPTVVYFEETMVSGVNSGSIKVEGRKISNDLNTKFKFTNSVFSNVTVELAPFISVSQNLVFEIENCSFIGFTSMSVIGGIFTASDRSVVKIQDSVFQNNSGVASTVFKVKTEAYIM